MPRVFTTRTAASTPVTPTTPDTIEAKAKEKAPVQIMPRSFRSLFVHQIIPDPQTEAARPGPLLDLELEKIKSLADSMRLVGQLQPVTVIEAPKTPEDRRKPEDPNLKQYFLIAGRRRFAAAQLIEKETGQDFKLHAIVWGDDLDAFRAAVHENIKRRGLTPLQFAHLIQSCRLRFGWQGAKEVAEFLGVSRAQVYKLLEKPAHMPQEVYDALLAKIASGRTAADSAFYALTHVTDAEELKRAEELAAQEYAEDTDDVETAEVEGGEEADAEIAAEAAETEPAENAGNAQEVPSGGAGGSTSTPPPPAITPATGKRAKTTVPANSTTAKKAVASKKPIEPVKIQKKHLKQAVEETKVKKAKAEGKPEPATIKLTTVAKTHLHLNTFLGEMLDMAKENPLAQNFTVELGKYLEAKSTQSDVLMYWKRVLYLMKKATR